MNNVGQNYKIVSLCQNYILRAASLFIISFFSYICPVKIQKGIMSCNWQCDILFVKSSLFIGGLAQLARACDWQSQGHRFDSGNLHTY